MGRITCKEEEDNVQYQVKKIKRGRASCVEASFAMIFLLTEHCIVSCVSEFISSVRYITPRHAMVPEVSIFSNLD
jgi:hypothetical protein